MNVSARELNDDLRKISNWAFQWKMSFSPDVNKQAQKVIFSRKIKSNIDPPLVFNNVSQVNSQEHLGITSDFKGKAQFLFLCNPKNHRLMFVS